MKKYAAIFLLLLITLLSLSVHAAVFPFTDVEENTWYYNDVKTAYESGMINGSTPTEFSPDANLTCVEAVKLAACMHQLYIEGKVTLTNGDPWYQPYIDYAQDNEILQYQNILDPEAPINRGRIHRIFCPSHRIPHIPLWRNGMNHAHTRGIYHPVSGSGRFIKTKYVSVQSADV